MFGIGTPELLIILVIALVVIGPQKLPEIARSLGKGLAEFKKATNDFRTNMEREAREQEVAGRQAREALAAQQATEQPAPQETVQSKEGAAQEAVTV